MSLAYSHIQAPLINPTKRSLVDKTGKWGDYLNSEFLEIILPPKISFH